MNKLLEKTLLPHWLVVIWTFVPRMPFNDIFMASYVNQWFEKASSWMSSVKMENTGLTLYWILTLKLLRISAEMCVGVLRNLQLPVSWSSADPGDDKYCTGWLTGSPSVWSSLQCLGKCWKIAGNWPQLKDRKCISNYSPLMSQIYFFLFKVLFGNDFLPLQDVTGCLRL